jgi:hypothetical protein
MLSGTRTATACFRSSNAGAPSHPHRGLALPRQRRQAAHALLQHGRVVRLCRQATLPGTTAASRDSQALAAASRRTERLRLRLRRQARAGVPTWRSSCACASAAASAALGVPPPARAACAAASRRRMRRSSFTRSKKRTCRRTPLHCSVQSPLGRAGALFAALIWGEEGGGNEPMSKRPGFARRRTGAADSQAGLSILALLSHGLRPGAGAAGAPTLW